MYHDIFNESIQLLIYGMGTVFVFLYILILATQTMSRLVLRFTPEVESAPPVKPKSPTPNVDPNVVAAIGLAVQEYRREHRQ
jgi:oxaloacetate decarboxylase gamma subunit